eukprot:809676-Pelagomonas_calceolata.AAC.4
MVLRWSCGPIFGRPEARRVLWERKPGKSTSSDMGELSSFEVFGDRHGFTRSEENAMRVRARFFIQLAGTSCCRQQGKCTPKSCWERLAFQKLKQLKRQNLVWAMYFMQAAPIPRDNWDSLQIPLHIVHPPHGMAFASSFPLSRNATFLSMPWFGTCLGLIYREMLGISALINTRERC